MTALVSRLDELKTTRNLMQKQVAKGANIPLRTYRRYENGEREPSASTLSALADFFDVSTDYLLGRSNNPQRIQGRDLMVYLVSCDLNEPEKNYPAIIKAIETYNANDEHFCKNLKSQWLIYSNKTAEQIFVHLRRFIDDDDELFVCELNANFQFETNIRVITQCKKNQQFPLRSLRFSFFHLLWSHCGG